MFKKMDLESSQFCIKVNYLSKQGVVDKSDSSGNSNDLNIPVVLVCGLSALIFMFIQDFIEYLSHLC